MCQKQFQRKVAAYIVTDNRGKRYLVFAGSVEHDNARMFGYGMDALYA
jgi:cAMP phosphodiesterase